MTETDPLPLCHLIRPADLTGRKPTRFDLQPDAQTLEKIAQWAGIERVESLRLVGALMPQGRTDWLLEAQFTARVVQACVVSLAPVTTDLKEDVRRRYLAQMPEPDGDEVEMPEDTDAEPLGDRIDLGEVALEVLELALPAYPRATDAALKGLQATPPGAAPLRDEDTRPFANLRDLLGGKAEGGPEDKS